MSREIKDYSVKMLRDKLDNKEISSFELTKYFIERVKKLNPNLNSIITLNEEQAFQNAANADSLISSNKQNILTGIPIIHKDNLCTKGIKTSAGSKMLDNFISPYNATIVNKCQDAGAIMIGKSNMDEFSMGSTNETSYYGAVKNPWSEAHIPGGSSGGSAAAIAARIAPLATGSDTGGSIRQPSAFCGVTGIKPTYGTVSRYGLIAFASSLDQVGTIAKSAEDCAYLLQSIQGYDPKDSTSIKRSYEPLTKSLNNSIKGKRIGIPIEYFRALKNENIMKALDKSIATYKTLGAEIKDISLKACMKYAVSSYYLIATAEASTNLSRYDGIRYGYRCKNPKDLEDLYTRSRSEGFGAEVKRRIMLGTFSLSSGYYDAYYTQAQKVRKMICMELEDVFKSVDIILSPTTPDMPSKLKDNSVNPIDRYLSDIYTTPANLAGLPAMSIPIGFSDMLPIGMQLIGKPFSESVLLNMANQYQNVTNFHKADITEN
jgi:aspartyl-tRNA(Asn)/glutamyl-tRNA(Gln) amidotransferase subunit A